MSGGGGDGEYGGGGDACSSSGSRTPSVTSSDGFLQNGNGNTGGGGGGGGRYQRLDDADRSLSSASANPSDAAPGEGEAGDDDGDEDIPRDEARNGTLASASFNLLSTMVGGGSLSLPLAFSQAGNALVGPGTLLVVAVISEFCMRCLVDAGREVERREASEERRRRAQAEEDCPGAANDEDEDGGSGAGDVDDGDGDAEGDRDRNRSANPRRKGTVTFESISSAAFGPRALYLSMALVSLICFFATVGYAVLLRDLIEPYVDYAFPPPEGTGGGPTVARNAGMWLVVLGVTPLCRLTNLTALRHVGAMSMCAVLILGVCVTYRSWQCNFVTSDTGGDDNGEGSDMMTRGSLHYSLDFSDPNHGHGSHNETDNCDDSSGDSCNGAGSHVHPRHEEYWPDYLTFVPSTLASFLSAFPIFVSCFICHYNVPPVCNELRRPTLSRSYSVVRYTVWSASAFYLLIGFAGSMYGNCTENGEVHGNVLLDFDEDDPLLLVGRTALACTVTLAFPMLVIPPRDIALRGWGIWQLRRREARRRRQRIEEGDDDAEDENSRGLGETGRSRNRGDGIGRKRGRFASLLRRGRGRTHPPSGAFPPAVASSRGGNGGALAAAMSADTDHSTLTEPFLPEEDEGEDVAEEDGTASEGVATRGDDDNDNLPPLALANVHPPPPPPTPRALLLTAIVIFWTAASAACCVSSIDVVWDLLGSSLSICLGFLIPCGAYAGLFGRDGTDKVRRREDRREDNSEDDEEDGAANDDEEDVATEERQRQQREETEAEADAEGGDADGDADPGIERSDRADGRMKQLSARAVVWAFVPMMVACTANAFYRTFLC